MISLTRHQKVIKIAHRYVLSCYDMREYVLFHLACLCIVGSPLHNPETALKCQRFLCQAGQSRKRGGRILKEEEQPVSILATDEKLRQAMYRIRIAFPKDSHEVMTHPKSHGSPTHFECRLLNRRIQYRAPLKGCSQVVRMLQAS